MWTLLLTAKKSNSKNYDVSPFCKAAATDMWEQLVLQRNLPGEIFQLVGNTDLEGEDYLHE